jgi:hypothetical protein
MPLDASTANVRLVPAVVKAHARRIGQFLGQAGDFG